MKRRSTKVARAAPARQRPAQPKKRPAPAKVPPVPPAAIASSATVGQTVVVDRRETELRNMQIEMDRFAYTISHDLRAPLIHIGGFVDLLLQHAGPKLDEQSRHYLQRVAESTYHMGRMVDDVLALSRLSRAEIHLIRLEMKDLLKEVMNDLRNQTENRRIHWQIGGLPAVVADPTLLRLAVTNLVGNALKFSRKRAEAVIEISGRREGGETVFLVRDNGIGFDIKQQARLFGVFQRLHSAAESDGTGIGLAQVQRIVQRHGGRVWAEGAVDAGASFYFSLPDAEPERL